MTAKLICVVDDDADLAASVARMLGRRGFATLAVDEPGRLLALAGEQEITCVVTDINMPGMNGFEFAAALRAVDESVGIVFMTGMPSTRGAVDAVRVHGGVDYIDKPLEEERLLAAVAEAVEWSAKRRAVQLRIAELSPREREVLGLLGRGYSNKQVAGELGLSARTVEDHRAAIMRKTGVGGLAEMVELARALAAGRPGSE